ncbi:hypothetical protein AVEN_28244-1 [Araneus ventricosus]|uniref:Uncharacterized protein n=1 Tax=Araneus ventricosus TaxID=182803 RepID=A0A4Y2U412_ARAVE|nr:hypothetical protein AVEN_28244-1 [Araneus ventricosus]
MIPETAPPLQISHHINGRVLTLTDTYGRLRTWRIYGGTGLEPKSLQSQSRDTALKAARLLEVLEVSEQNLDLQA